MDDKMAETIDEGRDRLPCVTGTRHLPAISFISLPACGQIASLGLPVLTPLRSYLSGTGGDGEVLEHETL